MKLLQIVGDEKTVWSALEDEAGIFSDNGGDPDGPQWLRPADDFCGDLLEAALATGEAVIVVGFESEYEADPWNEVMVQFAQDHEGWCGYSADGKAYFLNEKDAELCQATTDAWQENQDMDSIAHRVHAIA